MKGLYDGENGNRTHIAAMQKRYTTNYMISPWSSTREVLYNDKFIRKRGSAMTFYIFPSKQSNLLVWCNIKGY